MAVDTFGVDKAGRTYFDIKAESFQVSSNKWPGRHWKTLKCEINLLANLEDQNHVYLTIGPFRKTI